MTPVFAISTFDFSISLVFYIFLFLFGITVGSFLNAAASILMFCQVKARRSSVEAPPALGERSPEV